MKMMFDNSKIQFSKIDIGREITLPVELDKDLAYLMGFHLGDGHMRQYKRLFGVESTIFYDGHSINEYSHYEQNICPLIKRLFNYKCKINIRKDSNNLNIIIGSRAIVDFMHLQCKLPLGPKTNANIPDIIKSASVKIKCVFLRGLADTDFSLTFKKRTKTDDYPVINFQTGCKSLYEDAKNLLTELGFKIVHNYRKSYRYDKVHDSYYIQISGRNQLKKWMNEVGFTSQNHITRYLVWKKLGYLPAGTNILKRLEILGESALDQTRTGDLLIDANIPN